VFMRANIEFPLFDITIDNVGKAPPVLFDPSVSDNSRASIWHVRDILALAGAAKMPHTGALIVAVFEYACDFNNGMNCLPQVSCVYIFFFSDCFLFRCEGLVSSSRRSRQQLHRLQLSHSALQRERRPARFL
jgi:hypothetical protein